MNPALSRVVLVGPMGSGKSTVGKCLASVLGIGFVDSDKELEKRCGADIPWIFDLEGEQGFRKRETAVLTDLAELKDIVIATGGGAVVSEENRQLLRACGTVVYLTSDLDTLFARVQRDSGRPLLQVGNPRETYEKILAERDLLYRDTADLVMVTDAHGSPMKVARTIARQLSELT